MTTDQLRREIDELVHWMYESSGNSKYILAGRKPLNPNDARDQIMAVVAKHDRSILKPIEDIFDKLGDDYGEFEALDDIEKYVAEQRRRSGLV